MGKIRYIIIAKQCEVAGTSSILDGCLEKSFTSVCDLGKRFFGHPSHIDDVPCNLTQFCYITQLFLKGYRHTISHFKTEYKRYLVKTVTFNLS